MQEASWVDTTDVSVPFDEKEFAELLFTSRGFLRLHATTQFARDSHVRTVMDEVIEIGEGGEPSYPVILAHPYRVWIDFNKVLKKGLGGADPTDADHRELRLRIAKKIDFSATQVGARMALHERASRQEKSAERVERLGSRELYNYGILLSLAEEQNAALEQSTEGRLDWWGRSRIDSRSDAIQKQLLAIGKHKAQQGFGSTLVDEVRSDLDGIAEAGLLGRHYSGGAFRVVEEKLQALETEVPWAYWGRA